MAKLRRSRAEPPKGRQDGRHFAIRVDASSEESRTVDMSFSSEDPYERWFGNEILSHRPEDINLKRLAEVGAVLFSHGMDANYSRMPIARIERVWLDEATRKARATIRFDEDEDSDKVFRKVLSGSIRGVSVGYSVEDWLELDHDETSEDGRFAGPAYVAVKWTPIEISIEPTPADPTVGVGRSMNEGRKTGMAGKPQMATRKKSKAQRRKDEADKLLRRMARLARADEEDERENELEEDEERDEEETEEKELSEDEDDREDDLEEDQEREGEEDERDEEEDGQKGARRQNARSAERRRAADISGLCKTFGVDPTPHIKSGKSMNQVRAAILQKLAAERGAMPNVRVQADERDKLRAAASDALRIRAGRAVDKPAPGATELRGMSLRDLAVDCVLRAGNHSAPHRMSNDDLMRAALTPDSAFVSILDDSINKTLSAAYQAAPTTYQLWTGTGSVSDFKPNKHYRISEFGELSLMTQNGEFKQDESKDEGVEKAIATYGKGFGFTREAMINDDLSVLTRIPESAVRAAGRGINTLVYKMLAGNPAIYDQKQLFSADHKNLAATAGKPSVLTLGEGRKAMRTQSNIRGLEKLNIPPRFLILPASLETMAYQLLNSEADPAATHAGVKNPFHGTLIPVVDAELDAYSENSWYMAAAPGEVDTIEVTYLNGDSTPKLESQLSFNRLGIDWRIYIDYGVTVLDYRGLYKNAGQ